MISRKRRGKGKKVEGEKGRESKDIMKQGSVAKLWIIRGYLNPSYEKLK